MATHKVILYEQGVMTTIRAERYASDTIALIYLKPKNCVHIHLVQYYFPSFSQVARETTWEMADTVLKRNIKVTLSQNLIDIF